MQSQPQHRRAIARAIFGLTIVLTSGIGSAFAQEISLHAAENKSAAIQIEELKRSEPVDFAREILPIFRANCTACHNATDHEAELSLETPEAVYKGGESGAAVVPGKAMESLLLRVAARLDKPFMPPKNNKVGAKPLTPQELGLLKLWIDQGGKGATPTSGSPAPVPAAVAKLEYQPLPEGLNPIYAVAVTQDGQLAACNRANQIFIYSLPKRQLLTRLTDPALLDTAGGGRPGVAHRDLVQSLAFSPDGKLLASGGYREVKLWQRPEPAVRLTLPGVAAKRVGTLATSRDGKVLAVGGDDGIVRLFDLPEGKARIELKGHAGEVTAVRFSADGAQVFTGSSDKSVRVWNAADAKPVGQIDTPHVVAAMLVLEPKGGARQIITGGGDNVIRLWAMPGAAGPAGPAGAVRELAGHTAPVTSLASLPGDPARFFSGSADGTVRQWTLGSANPERQFDHGAPVACVAVRADGTALVSAGGTFAKVFDLRSGQLVATIKGDRGATESAQLAERTFNFQQSEAAFRKQQADAATQAQAAATQAVAAGTAAKAAADKAVADKQAASTAKLAAKETADKALAAVPGEIQSATQAVAAADKLIAERKAAADGAAAKRAQLAAASQKAAEDAQVLAMVAERVKGSADTTAADAAAKAKAEAAAKTVSDAAAAESESARKAAADAMAAAERQPDDEKLKEAAARAARVAQEAAAKAKAVAEAHGKAVKAARDAAGSAEYAAAAHEKGRKSADDAAVAAKAAVEALASGEKSVADAQSAFTAANEAKAAAEKALAAATAKQAPADAAAKQAAAEAAQAAKDADAARAAVATADRNLAEAQAGARTTEAQLALRNADAALAQAAAAKAQVELDHARKAATDSEKPVTSVAFSPDGATLITGGTDGVARTHAADTGAPADVLRGHDGPVTALAVRPDGTVLTCSADRSVKAWEVNPAWTLKATIGTGDDRSPLSDRVLALAFSPDGSLLATGGGVPSRSGELKLWSAATGQLFRDFPQAHSDTVFGLSFSGDGRLLASGAADKFARVWNVPAGTLLRSFEGHTHHVLDVSLRHDGRTLVTTGADNAVKLWDVSSGEQRKANNAFSKFEVTSAAHVGFTDRFLVTTGDGLARLLKEDLTPERTFDVPAPATFLYAGAATPDGTVILTGGYDSVLRIRDGRDGKVVADLPAPAPPKPN